MPNNSERLSNIGGQAVLEGVMMRGPRKYVVSVRRPDGTIVSMEEDLPTWRDRFPFLKLVLVRGGVALVEALTLAVKAIGYSAQQSTDEEVDISPRDLAISVVIGFGLAFGFFFAFPVWAARFFGPMLAPLRETSTLGTVLYNLVEGSIRLALFFLYLWLVSRLGDIRRVFEYHGAEHRAIHAYEHRRDLTPAELAGFGTEHLRCGTSFLLVVMVTSIVVFVFLGRPSSIFARIVSRLIVLPLVAGISYEIIRFAGRHEESGWIKVVMWPGLALQRLTTRTPDDGQMEVAIHSLKRLLEAEARVSPG